MSGPRTKKSKTEPEDAEDTVDEKLISQLEAIQEQIEEFNDKATEEILEVERKYNRLRKPIFELRNEAIRKIPEFWVKVFTSQEMLAALLVDNDIAAFKYLKELNVEDHDDVKSGFKISLKFDPNPFFKNEVLSKEFRYDKDGNLTVTPTKIEWKEGKDLTKKAQAKDAKGKRTRDDESDSFFTWFNPEDQDLELAEIIKEELWPNPTKYYLGLVDDDQEAEEEGDEGEGDEAEEEGEGEGEDGDEGAEGAEGAEGVEGVEGAEEEDQ